MKVSASLVRISFCLPPCESWVLNSGTQALTAVGKHLTDKQSPWSLNSSWMKSFPFAGSCLSYMSYLKCHLLRDCCVTLTAHL